MNVCTELSVLADDRLFTNAYTPAVKSSVKKKNFVNARAVLK
jgi:hypothetical protein